MGKHRRSRKLTWCLRCGGHKLHEARGLCKCCYNHLREERCPKGESLEDYPTATGRGTWVGTTSSKRYYDPGFIRMKEARNDYL